MKDGHGRIQGFGHRVYKHYDPRATIIRKIAYDVFEIAGKNPLLDIALKLEETALADEYFTSRRLYPNVDFYSGFIYQAMGFPTDMFTVLFALARTSGWVAHWAEMLDGGERIARPRQLYTGGQAARLRADRRTLAQAAIRPPPSRHSSVLVSTAGDPEERHRRGDGDVQRTDRPVERDPATDVAAPLDEWREPRPSAPTTIANGSVAISSESSGVSPSGSSPTVHTPRELSVVERRADPRHERDREVLDRPGRGFHRRRREVRRPVAGEHDTGRSRAEGAAQDRAEVVRIGHLGDDDDERNSARRASAAGPWSGLAATSCVEPDRLDGRGPGDDTLGGLSAGGGTQLECGRHPHRHPRCRREGDHLVEQRRGILALGDNDLGHGPPAGGEELAHRAATFDVLAPEAAVRAIARAAPVPRRPA